MTTGPPANDPGDDADDVPRAEVDEGAAPGTGTEPDTAGPDSAMQTDPAGGGPQDPDTGTGPAAAAKTVLDGPALENEQMRRGTEDLRSSQDKIVQAREFAEEVARRTEPEPPTRPGDGA